MYLVLCMGFELDCEAAKLDILKKKSINNTLGGGGWI